MSPGLKRARWLAVAGVCGIISPLIVLTLVLLAILYSPWFSWTENALSDLGVQGNVALLFNFSLIIGGLLLTLFTVGLGETVKNRIPGRIGAVILTLDAALLSTIGIFPETAGAIHFYLSVAFFTLLPISLLLIGGAMMQEPSRRSWGSFTLLTGTVAATVWALPRQGAAIPEALAFLTASLWYIAVGIHLFRESTTSP